MKIVTRIKAIENLNKYIGQDLGALAAEYNITVVKHGKQNKGWKGLVLERLAGLENNVSKAPNGLSFELKSVSFIHRNNELLPKETMAISMINPEELKHDSFFNSHTWAKLKSLVFCAVAWNGASSKKSKLVSVTSFDFAAEDDLIKEIEKDYEFIRNKLIKNGFSSLTGKDGKWIQARTKGAGHGSVSRAFYARKKLVKRIFDISK
ncbi:hypothetical protein C4564_04085 [Candidatus Microgenomates bacterium]|nr:MAG: hypothetical protein C4564_04085 [Candidatus Microgenomates bacterium]